MLVKLPKSQEVYHRKNWETIKNEHDQEIRKGRYVSQEERQTIIHDMTLI